MKHISLMKMHEMQPYQSISQLTDLCTYSIRYRRNVILYSMCNYNVKEMVINGKNSQVE